MDMYSTNPKQMVREINEGWERKKPEREAWAWPALGHCLTPTAQKVLSHLFLQRDCEVQPHNGLST